MRDQHDRCTSAIFKSLMWAVAIREFDCPLEHWICFRPLFLTLSHLVSCPNSRPSTVQVGEGWNLRCDRDVFGLLFSTHCYIKVNHLSLIMATRWNWLFNKSLSLGNLFQLTTYTVLMEVDTGAMETYMQYCPDPCWPWWNVTHHFCSS